MSGWILLVIGCVLVSGIVVFFADQAAKSQIAMLDSNRRQMRNAFEITHLCAESDRKKAEIKARNKKLETFSKAMREQNSRRRK